jgi:hypothetical protein
MLLHFISCVLCLCFFIYSLKSKELDPKKIQFFAIILLVLSLCTLFSIDDSSSDLPPNPNSYQQNISSNLPENDSFLITPETSYPDPETLSDYDITQETDAPKVITSKFYTSSFGNGDSVFSSVDIFTPSYLHFSTIDDGHHSVKAFYGKGDNDYDLLVNSTDPYSGKTLLLSNRTYDFVIECDGAWNLSIYTIGYTDLASFSGSGDSVTDHFYPRTQYYTINYSGTDHFSVKQWWGTGEHDYELLVNESGDPYNGTVRLSHIDSPCFFEICGEEGSWTITPNY